MISSRPYTFNPRFTTHLISSKSRISSHAARIMPLWWMPKYSGAIQRMAATVTGPRARMFFFSLFFSIDSPILRAASSRLASDFDMRADRREIISHSSRRAYFYMREKYIILKGNWRLSLNFLYKIIIEEESFTVISKVKSTTKYHW